MNISQIEFNQFVLTFNENLIELLQRAALGTFDERLVRSFVWLKDTYEVILRFHDGGFVGYEVALHPISLRGNHELLNQWGFDQPQIQQIMSFLDFFRNHQGRELADVVRCNQQSG